MYSNPYHCFKEGDQEDCSSYRLKLTDNANKKTEYQRIEFDEDNTYKKLQQCKLNETLEKSRRQLLRANNHELRQLERQLQSAVIFKQLKEQQQNVAILRQQQFRKKHEENVKLARESEEFRMSLLQQEQLEKRNKFALLETLKSQMTELQLKRQIEFEEVQKDRDEMERRMKQIEAEKILERKEAQLLREMCREEMEQNFRDIKLKRQLENERNADLTARNVAYQKEFDNLKSLLLADRQRSQKERDALRERLGQQLAKKNEEKEKREALFLTLLVEEYKAKEDQDFKEALMERVNKRENFRIEMESYLRKNQIANENQFVEEEKQFYEENLRQLEQRDKIYQLSNEKIRRKKMEHIKALREMIETRRSEKANELAARIVEFEKMKINEEKNEQLIEEERIFMLSAVPKELLRYLPPGVLKSLTKNF